MRPEKQLDTDTKTGMRRVTYEEYLGFVKKNKEGFQKINLNYEL